MVRNVRAIIRHACGADRVIVRDDDAIAALLNRVGACEVARDWAVAREAYKAGGTATRRANFHAADTHRAIRAAMATVAAVERTLAVPADAPRHLAAAGRLRLQHPTVTIDELGRLAEPPVSKDTMAGRIRRLLAMADYPQHVMIRSRANVTAAMRGEQL